MCDSKHAPRRSISSKITRIPTSLETPSEALAQSARDWCVETEIAAIAEPRIYIICVPLVRSVWENCRRASATGVYRPAADAVLADTHALSGPAGSVRPKLFGAAIEHARRSRISLLSASEIWGLLGGQGNQSLAAKVFFRDAHPCSDGFTDSQTHRPTYLNDRTRDQLRL
jgi:hypothetical protein